MKEIEKFSSPGIVKLLVGNKCDDATNWKVSYEEGLDLAEMYKVSFIETSAKSGTNISEAFNMIGKTMKDTHIVAPKPVNNTKVLKEWDSWQIRKKSKLGLMCRMLLKFIMSYGPFWCVMIFIVSRQSDVSPHPVFHWYLFHAKSYVQCFDVSVTAQEMFGHVFDHC